MNSNLFLFLKKKKNNPIKLFLGCLIFFLSMEFSYAESAQQSLINISGTVTEETGDEAIGASVIVKGTPSLGTATDLNGGFTLNKVPSNAVLIVSYVGYTSKEVAVNGRNTINITLSVDPTMLKEVVAVGYGSVKRENLLGAVTNMTTEEIQDVPVATLSEALTGKMVGVNIGVNTGKVGTTSKLSVRNNSSYSASSQDVLYVIDDIVRDKDAFDMLDPMEVESISVLKDAAAAVYGVRSAGGVVVVKTKMGQEGKAKITYSGTFGITDRASKLPKLMSGTDHATFMNDAYDTAAGRYSSANEGLTLDEFRDQNPNKHYYFTDDDFAEIAKREGKYDWLDEAWSSALTTKHNINISGGTKDVKYFAGGSYYKQTGNIGNLSLNQYSFRAGVEAKIIKGLTGKFSIDTNRKNRKVPYSIADSGNTETMRYTFSTLMRMPSWMPYMVDGKPVYYQVNDEGIPKGGNSNDWTHPGAVENSDSYDRSISNATNFNIGLNYDFEKIKGLKVGVNFAQMRSNNNTTQYRIPYKLYELDSYKEGGHLPSETEFTGEYEEIKNNNRFLLGTSHNTKYQFNAFVQYARKFGKHDINAMFNYEESESDGENYSVWKEDVAVYNWENYNAFGGKWDGGNSYSLDARRSYIGRINYNYDEKYLFESSFRYEASYKFPKKNRWGFFPSVSLGWRVSEEEWFKNNVTFMDNLKLRASWGKLGDEAPVPRQWQRSWGSEKGGYLGDSSNALNGLTPSNSGLVNLDLNWETTYSYNVGFDANIFRNFNLGFDYWRKDTYDILTGTSLTSDIPTVVGADKMPNRNHGEMSSWGTEVSLTYNGRLNKDITYSIGGNLSWYDNKVKKKIQAQDWIGTWRDEEGRRSDSGIEGYKYLGIIRTQEQLDQLQADNMEKYGKELTMFGSPLELGMMYYEDLNENGEIDQNDQMRLKSRSSNPYAYGIHLRFSWKSLSFSTQFTGSWGGHQVISKYDMEVPSVGKNALAIWNDHWTPENPNASMPRADRSDNYRVSDFWIVDGAELRWRSATLSYTVPTAFASKLSASDIRVFASANNLLTLISPFDFKDGALSYFYSYPILRTINFGLNITF